MAGNRWLFAGVVLVIALCKCTVSFPVPQLHQTGEFDSKELTNDIIDQDVTVKEHAHDLAVVKGIQDETDETYIDEAYGFDDDDSSYDDFENDAQQLDDEDDMIIRLFQLRGRGRGKGKGGGGGGSKPKPCSNCNKPCPGNGGGGGGGGGGGYNWQQYVGSYYKKDKDDLAKIAKKQ